MGIVRPKAFERPGGERIGVAILGATGSVGQRFVQLLEGHPWFEVRALCASESRVGQAYAASVRWVQDTPVPGALGAIKLSTLGGLDLGSTPLVFSALPSEAADPAEKELAARGFWVVSNASSHRMRPDVPLLVPEINRDHLALIDRQAGPGVIVCGPNCSTAGLVLALAPLERSFGLEAASVVTMQAHSGAGLPGTLGEIAEDNVLPWIPGEEDKLETEPAKILGDLDRGKIEAAPVRVSANCFRVPVRDGHTVAASVQLRNDAKHGDILRAWETFPGLDLPSAPVNPVVYLTEKQAPNPKQHRALGHGMPTLVGQLRPCDLLGWKFSLLSHNTLRGAAGGAILIGECLVEKG